MAPAVLLLLLLLLLYLRAAAVTCDCWLPVLSCSQHVHALFSAERFFEVTPRKKTTDHNQVKEGFGRLERGRSF